jgi:hypothetical protein
MTAKRRALPDTEQMIGALIPARLPRPRPVPPPLPSLPTVVPSADSDTVALGIARVDASGRVCARALLQCLGWHPGHRIRIDVTDGTIMVGHAPLSAHVIGARGAIAIPVAARQLCALTNGTPVLLLAYIEHSRLLVISAADAARVLTTHYAHLLGPGRGNR